jgi:hypothetical protein
LDRVQALRTELKADFETRIAQLEHRLTVVGIHALVVSVGLILAAIRYLPHS